jgi:hypothetical protein
MEFSKSVLLVRLESCRLIAACVVPVHVDPS